MQTTVKQKNRTRRMVSRVAVAGALVVVPLAAVAVPAFADTPSAVAIDRDNHNPGDRDNHNPGNQGDRGPGGPNHDDHNQPAPAPAPAPGPQLPFQLPSTGSAG
ncbi:hypothetical protein AB0L57_06765 [Nocardia sp. NPDC052254]|uniref:hypothetical protein n=1 Tax=Nocardia sp. NPDC052254 TaxID=3155681 RepID=UPI00343D69C6